ncbi:hypothetical protein L249_3411 [Ophiocordyceps polyrhachis-furcata BCC 54312]|uniref:J domain-containing protein n=1 Tax=Ophiocordyceps polyrhachis-furcata BCC 54312 TaxID=1330021 RepID=A0A367LMD2_9HYPO|nr:hypothetical protein L249_3411 [Ophiocordyceps polyrhachis-furcata BCC 54312]
MPQNETLDRMMEAGGDNGCPTATVSARRATSMASNLRSLAPRPPGCVLATTDEQPSCKDHADGEWRAMKGLIERLYIVDNRKLSETMAILESRHGFAATEQMYKKRLKKWNIRKRNYCSRSSLSLKAPPGHVYRPERYAGLELVLDSVSTWSRSKLEEDAVVQDSMSRYLENPHSTPLQDSRTMYRTFELVFDLWHHGRGQLAGMAARRAFYALEFVLTEDHPDLVWHVLDAVYDMLDRGHFQLLGMFLAYANVLAKTLLPAEGHPLVRILQQLRSSDLETEDGRRGVRHMLRQAWLGNVGILGRHVHSPSPRHLWLYEQLIWDGHTRLRKGTNGSGLAHSRHAILDTLGRLLESYDPAHRDGLRIRALMLEYTQMDLGDTRRAEKLAMDLVRRTASSNGDQRSNARFHAYARKMLARVQQEKRDWAAAEENLRWAVSKREAAHGAESDLRVIRDMWVLVKHLQRAGRLDDAARTAQDAIARAACYLRAGLPDEMAFEGDMLPSSASMSPLTLVALPTDLAVDAILGVSETATDQQIRDAYKRAALKTHPDRVASDSPERPVRTRKFQLVNDAYYTLSDSKRRRDYDIQRKLFGNKTTEDPFAEADDEPPQPETGGGSSGSYSWAWNFFTRQARGGGGEGGGGGGGATGNGNGNGDQQRTQNEQFEDVFEEMMREEGLAEDGTNRPTNKFWSMLGGVSGGALGFIVANVPGMVAGAVAGNRLGAVRDAKGKSVYSVFLELPQDARARLLSQLAARVFSHAVGV